MKRTLCEEVGVSVDQFAAHRGCSKLSESFALVSLLSADLNLLDLVDGHRAGSPQPLHDGLTADSLFDKLFDLLKNLPSEYYHGCCSIANFGVL